MNIHEHQAKALLKTYGLPVAHGVAIFKPEEAEAAAKSLPGPLYVVKSQIHAGGRGKGRFKELGRRCQGRRAPRQDRRPKSSANAKEMLGNTLVTKQTGAVGQAGQPPLHRRRRRYRARALLLAAGQSRDGPKWPSSSRPKAAWTSRPSRMTRPRRSSPSTSIRSTGVTAADIDDDRRCAEARGRGARRCDDRVPGALQGLRRQGHEPARGEPADRHARTATCGCSTPRSASTTTPLFRHPELMRAARPHRGGRQGDRGQQVRSRLCRARRHYRLHGQWRRPRHGHHGHHQALRRRAGELPRCRRRREQGEGHRGLQDHHRRSGRSKASWSTSSAASCAATSSPKASSPR